MTSYFYDRKQLRRKFIGLNSVLREKGRPQINNLSIHLKKSGKTQKNNCPSCKKKENEKNNKKYKMIKQKVSAHKQQQKMLIFGSFKILIILLKLKQDLKRVSTIIISYKKKSYHQIPQAYKRYSENVLLYTL